MGQTQNLPNQERGQRINEQGYLKSGLERRIGVNWESRAQPAGLADITLMHQRDFGMGLLASLKCMTFPTALENPSVA